MAPITDELRDSGSARVQKRGLVRGAVIHLANEQPLVVDLFGYPGPGDVTVICTNARSTTGKRPIWADHSDSIFYFPWTQIRFLEVPPDRNAPLAQPPAADSGVAVRDAAEESEEIDEEFLRRVRDA